MTLTARQLARPRRAGWCARHWTPRGLVSIMPRGATSRILARGPGLRPTTIAENVMRTVDLLYP
eukprot:COSAG06_NODE_1265_length_10064_cov_8.150828_7_plen_64_part_00